jgi:EAL domain-containing protein (putative c-di-GMP-specific phosphodiesterase class I)
MREAIRWQKIAPYPVQVAVNVSSVQFRSKGFVEEVSFRSRTDRAAA